MTTAHEDQYAPEPDPVFTTRAELEAWVEEVVLLLSGFGSISEIEEASREIVRVTLAHLHLKGE